MPKIGLIADPHFANHAQFGQPSLVAGINYRLHEIGEAFFWALNYLGSHDVTDIVVLGDVTHEHGKLTPSILTFIEAQLHRACACVNRNKQFNITFLSGNHDLDKNGISILSAFSHWVQVLPQKYTSYYVDDTHSIEIGALPYMSYGKTLEYLDRCDAEVILMHHDFMGAACGSHEYTSKSPLSTKDLPLRTKLVISGHYHKHQVLESKAGVKVVYCGGLLQHDFGERTYTPGFMILDTETLDWEHIEIPNSISPRFHVLPHTQDLNTVPGNKDRDYYCIEIPANENMKSLDAFRKVLGNMKVKVISSSSVKVRSRVEEHMKLENPSKISVTDVMGVYATMHTSSDVRAKELLDIGNTIISESAV
jgi:hypothetical protein